MQTPTVPPSPVVSATLAATVSASACAACVSAGAACVSAGAGVAGAGAAAGSELLFPHAVMDTIIMDAIATAITFLDNLIVLNPPFFCLFGDFAIFCHNTLFLLRIMTTDKIIVSDSTFIFHKKFLENLLIFFDFINYNFL
jgi:hypothetical protein